MLFRLHLPPDFNTPHGIKYIDRVVSCSIPGESDMKDLMSRVQMRKHSHPFQKEKQTISFTFHSTNFHWNLDFNGLWSRTCASYSYLKTRARKRICKQLPFCFTVCVPSSYGFICGTNKNQQWRLVDGQSANNLLCWFLKQKRIRYPLSRSVLKTRN